MSIRKKTISGLFWTFSQQFMSVGINFLVSVVLARLMLPAQFGLIGMVSVFVAVGEALMNGGLASSLIRTENPDQADYSTVFFVNFFLSLLIYGIVFFSAPLIAAFFRQEALVGVIRVYMICIILYSFSAVPVAKLTRELRFKRLMIYHIPSLAASGLAGIVLAYKGFGVWALVYMNLAQAFLYCIQLWIRSRWMPAWIFDTVRLKQHFSFGFRLVLSSVLDRIYMNAYNMVIGRFYSPVQLGYYTRSNTLVQIPSGNIYEALNKVAYPVLSEIRDDRERLSSAYKRMTQQALFIIIPVLTLMLLIAEPLFRVLLTDKWLPAVPYFRLLCIGAILNTVNGYNLTVLLIKGRSDLYLRLNIIEKALITTGILLMVPSGIYGLLYFQVAASVIIYLINGYTCGRLIGYPVWRQLKDILPVFLIALVSGFTAYCLDVWLRGDSVYMKSDLVHILVLCVFYTVLYIGPFVVFKVREIRDFHDLFLVGIREKYLPKKTKCEFYAPEG
jgi:teichuronic acid exporter